MKIYRSSLTALAAGLLALSACGSTGGNAQDSALTSPFTKVVKVLVGVLKPTAAPVDPRKVLTRQAIDASPTPVLLAGLETRNAHATLSPIGENQGVTSWVTGDGIGLSFRQGVLISTRGLGQDLMAADIDSVIKAIQAGQGTAIRIHDYLDGEDQIVRRSFHCTIRTIGNETLNIYGLSVLTRHVVETCRNPDLNLENHYWLSNGNRVRQSLQWVSPDLKYVSTQQLSR